MTPPAVGLAAVLTADQVAGGVRAAGGGVVTATVLANEVLAMSGRKTVLAVAVGLVLAGGAGTGVGVLSARSGGPQGPAPQQPPAAKADDLETIKRDMEEMQKRLERLSTKP